MAKKARPKEVTLTGTIMPSEWDEDDQVTGIMLLTEDEEEYPIVVNPIQEELLDFVKHEVELTGTLGEDEEGSPIFETISFEVLDEDEDEYEEEEEEEYDHDYLEDEKDDDEDDEDDEYR